MDNAERVRKRRILRRVMGERFPDAPVPYNKLIWDCGREIARLKDETPAFPNDPRKLALFHKVAKERASGGGDARGTS